jgi:hypothetical protein
MKTTRIKNIPVAHREVSVVVSENTDIAMRHSCMLAREMQKLELNTLLVNCGVSPQRFRDYAPKSTTFYRYDAEEEEAVFTPNTKIPNPKSQMLTLDSVRGNVAGQSASIREIIEQCQIKILILSGWEWSSSSWRRKEKLLYFLREIMAELGVAVIVYAQTTTNPISGENDKGGIGKLASISFAITDLRGAAISSEIAPSIPPIVMSQKEWVKAERSARLLVSKINGIELPQTHPSDYPTADEELHEEYNPIFAGEEPELRP